MENNEFEINHIKNCTCKYFDDIIYFEDFYCDNILIDENLYETTLLYDILCKFLIGLKPLRSRFNKVILMEVVLNVV